MVSATVPAVGTVHSAFDFLEPRCFQLEAPERRNKDLWVGLQQRQGLHPPPSFVAQPHPPLQLTAAPGGMDGACAAPPPPVSIPGEPSGDFLAGRWKDKIIARYSSEQE